MWLKVGILDVSIAVASFLFVSGSLLYFSLVDFRVDSRYEIFSFWHSNCSLSSLLISLKDSICLSLFILSLTSSSCSLRHKLPFFTFLFPLKVSFSLPFPFLLPFQGFSFPLPSSLVFPLISLFLLLIARYFPIEELLTLKMSNFQKKISIKNHNYLIWWIECCLKGFLHIFVECHAELLLS